MRKISVIGHFDFGKENTNGQTVKVKIVTDELCARFGAENVIKIDTAGGKSVVLKTPFQCIAALKKSNNIVIFPAQNGVRVYVPLLSFFRKFFRNRKLFYVVIGGWLPDLIKKHARLKAELKRLDGIYVETNTMKRAMERQGFTNIVVMPNCKKLSIVSPKELVYSADIPYKFCTFSRVMKEKGIEDAVNVVKEINKEAGKTICTLDIYGPVDLCQLQWFNALKGSFPEYIKYGGVIDYDKSVEVLKFYFALLFPTHYYTEGIPGTIIDAYAAGVPVVAAKWENFSDIVDEGGTGLGYEFNNEEALKCCLMKIIRDPHSFNMLKVNCLNKSVCFTPFDAMKSLVDDIND